MLIRAVQERVDLYSFRQGQEVYENIIGEVKALRVVPSNIYSKYRKDIEFGQAVGIYMGVENSRYYITRPTLLIREDAKHWTLIHEYTHHLFNEARAAYKLNLPEDYLNTFTDHSETLEDSFRRYENNNFHFKDRAHLDEYILCLKVSVALRIKMLLQFELEEVAVESLINRFYAKKKTLNYDPEYASNSTQYVRLNLKHALAAVEGYIKLINVVVPGLTKTSADFKLLQGYKNQLHQLKTQIAQFK